MSTAPYLPGAGHIVWPEFDPALGPEQAGRRPALVISPALFAEQTDFAIVCPITSKVRPFPTSVVPPEGLSVSGEVLLNQLCSVDIMARPVRFSGVRLSAAEAAKVREKLDLILTL